MSRIAEFHVLQNFAPSNLNRDDTGAPKDAVFGGVRRARISSQCAKRAIRLMFNQHQLIGSGLLADRTKRVFSRIDALLAERGRSDNAKVIEAALAVIDLKLKKKSADAEPQTEYLLFIGREEVGSLVAAIDEHYDQLAGGKPDKAAKNAIESCLGSSNAVDVALFGRMLADRKDFNVDAAAQVAHAISTHRVDRDVDFFTAVDDFAPLDEAVSGMLGTVEFNSSCFYRYAKVDLDLLERNLGHHADMLLSTVTALLEGVVRAVPSGKQNTFAAHNPPAFVAVSVRRGMPVSLANAFERPVSPGEHASGLTAASVARVEDYAATLSRAYGDIPLTALDLTGAWKGARVESLAELGGHLAKAMAALE
jgi:CRISPR system Cascade subunit CasC